MARQTDKPAYSARSNASRSASLNGRDLPQVAVAGDEDGLRLGGELTVSRADLLAQREARVADPLEGARDDDLLVLEAELAPEVDRDACENEIPRVARIAERVVDPLVATLLEVGRVDGVVDVHVRVDVAPADLDTLLMRHGRRS